MRATTVLETISFLCGLGVITALTCMWLPLAILYIPYIMLAEHCGWLTNKKRV